MGKYIYYVFYDRFKPVIPTRYFDNIDEAIECFKNQSVTDTQWIALGIQSKMITKTENVCFDLVHKHPGQFYVLVNDYKNHGNEFEEEKNYVVSEMNIRYQFDTLIYKYGSFIPYNPGTTNNINKNITKINEVYVSRRENNISLGWMTLDELNKNIEFSYLNYPIIHHVNVSYEVEQSSDSGQMDISADVFREYLYEQRLREKNK